MKYNTSLNVGDILEMKHGMSNHVVINKGPHRDRVDVWPVSDIMPDKGQQKRFIGVPMSWVKKVIKHATT